MEQYFLKKSNTPHMWECYDVINGLCCTFKEGYFNETQHYAFTAEAEILTEQPEKMAHICGQMGAWLSHFYYELIMPVSQESIRKCLGRRIRARREQCEVSLERLAEAVGTSANHLQRIEEGRYDVRMDVLGPIAHALGCHMDFVPNGPENDDERQDEFPAKIPT